jgi:hypothetical protein
VPGRLRFMYESRRDDTMGSFIWHGVTIANPFARTKHPLLKSLIAENS